jgi:hypothetical protein
MKIVGKKSQGWSLITLLSLLALSTESYSHVNFDAAKGMKPRNLSASVKVSDIAATPCGPDPTGADKATTVVANRMVFSPGQTYRVRWVESINHNSKYRLAFSPAANDVFSTVLMDLNQFDNNNVNPLDIPVATRQDKDTPEGSFVVTMPTALCENCSIQIIEKMFNGAGAGISATIYIGCMDVRIVNPATLVAPATPTTVKAAWVAD